MVFHKLFWHQCNSLKNESRACNQKVTGSRFDSQASNFRDNLTVVVGKPDERQTSKTTKKTLSFDVIRQTETAW